MNWIIKIAINFVENDFDKIQEFLKNAAIQLIQTNGDKLQGLILSWLKSLIK